MMLISYILEPWALRTLVDLPEEDLKALSTLAGQQGRSRSALMREAISHYLAAQRRSTAGDSFAAWKRSAAGVGLPADGLRYQETLRSEWER
jgi:predicted transcriptional regulator